MPAIYNENNPAAAAVLRQMIADGHIAPGVVDERSIRDIRADDLAGYDQVHLFAGGGFWSAALRAAGWPGDRPVWTGSCPCQPFSAAGRRKGVEDERHLWPEMHRLIRERRPAIVLGEQVAGRAGWAWFDAVSGDLEAAHYAVGAAGLTAAGFGAPHIRERIYWMAVSDRDGRARGAELDSDTLAGVEAIRQGHNADGRSNLCRLGDAEGDGRIRRPDATDIGRGQRASGYAGATRRLGDADFAGLEGRRGGPDAESRQCAPGPSGPDGPGIWSDPEWVWCSDRGGVWRPIERGTFPLADGRPGRAQVLHLAGNAIVLPVATAFCRAALEIVGG